MQKFDESLHGYVDSDNQIKHEYKYMKEEMLEGKDCILVKEETFSLENGKYINVNKITPEESFRVFWIEKSTGFVVGGATMKSYATTVTPTMIIRNISFGNVKDSDFDLPKDYKILGDE